MSKTAISPIYSFSAKTIDGGTISLESFRNKTLLIVNVASKCGFTPQYDGLEKLYQQYKDKDFVILGFPCNQFNKQEPGCENEIKNFTQAAYNVSFPMFSKIDVNGANAHPLFKYLQENQKGIFGSKAIKWNFTKFLIDKNGNIVKRYAPIIAPRKIGKDIEEII